MLEKVLRLAEELEGVGIDSHEDKRTTEQSAAAIRAMVEVERARRLEREKFFSGDVTLEEWHRAEDAVTAAVAKLDSLNDGLEV